jgi:shikimate dehydrogenase
MDISAKTFLPDLTGSFSVPAGQNPTVAMVEAAYRHHGLHYRYINCEVLPENLERAINGAKAMGWSGFNCSMPHKQTVVRYLDGLGESAKIIGAVNTVVLRDGKWIGENTDGKGFLLALKRVIDPMEKRVVLFGAGGAAYAIGVELALAGASHIIVVNRQKERGSGLVNMLKKNTNAASVYSAWTRKYEIPRDTNIIVNCTSLGMYPNVHEKLNIDFDSINADMIVADVIPNPPQTHFLKEAQGRGCRTIDGLQMLVNQGRIGIKYWTGTDVDDAVMHAELKKVFSEQR